MGTEINPNNVLSAPQTTSDVMARLLKAEPDPGAKNSSSMTSSSPRGKSAGKVAGSTTNKNKIPIGLLPGRTGGKVEMRALPGRTGDKVQFTPLTTPTGTGDPSSRPVIRTSFQPRFQLDVDSKTAGTDRSTTGGTVAQATGSSTDPLPRLSTEQLRQLNPNTDPREHDSAGGWTSMFKSPGFTEPIPGMMGVVTTKPILLGGGMSLPIGTKVADGRGNGPITYAQTYPTELELELPSGKKLTLTPERDKNGSKITRLTFDDGRFYRFAGSPFLNPKTGTLTRVQEVPYSADPLLYRMLPSLTGDSLGSYPARNGAMSGKEAEAALQNSLR